MRVNVDDCARRMRLVHSSANVCLSVLDVMCRMQLVGVGPNACQCC